MAAFARWRAQDAPAVPGAWNGVGGVLRACQRQRSAHGGGKFSADWSWWISFQIERQHHLATVAAFLSIATHLQFVRHAVGIAQASLASLYRFKHVRLVPRVICSKPCHVFRESHFFCSCFPAVFWFMRLVSNVQKPCIHRAKKRFL